MDNSQNAPEASLRSGLNSLVMAFVSGDSSPALTLRAAAKPADSVGAGAGKPRDNAVRFALGNFTALYDAAAGGITEESLRDKFWYGGFGSEGRTALAYLMTHMDELGHQVGTKTSTSYFAAGSFAMPVSFTKNVFVIDSLDLFKQMLSGAQSL